MAEVTEGVTEGVGAEDSASFYQWCADEAKKINSDGCTVVDEWNQPCCWEHDLGCHYGKDPRDAFRIALTGLPQTDGGIEWYLAKKMSRREADKRFAACNFKRSQDLAGFVRSGLRYLGVRIGSLWPF